jgi:hypothetical protein
MTPSTPNRIGLVLGLVFGGLVALRLFLHWPWWIIGLLEVAVPPLLWRYVWKYRFAWKGTEYKVPGYD